MYHVYVCLHKHSVENVHYLNLFQPVYVRESPTWTNHPDLYCYFHVFVHFCSLSYTLQLTSQVSQLLITAIVYLWVPGPLTVGCMMFRSYQFLPEVFIRLKTIHLCILTKFYYIIIISLYIGMWWISQSDFQENESWRSHRGRKYKCLIYICVYFCTFHIF